MRTAAPVIQKRQEVDCIMLKASIVELVGV